MGDKDINKQSEKSTDPILHMEDKDSNIDGGWGWVVCFSGFLCNIISFGIFMTFGIFLEPLMDHYKTTHSSMSLVGSFMSGTFMMSMAITSVFVNQYGCRIVGTIGGVATAISLGLSSVCPNITTLALCYGIMCGFGFGMVYMSLIVSCGYHFKKRLALAQGIMAVGASIGCMVFPPLANYLIFMYGWQNCLRIFAVLHLVCSVCSLSYRPVKKVKECNGHVSKAHSCDSIYITTESEQYQNNAMERNTYIGATSNINSVQSTEKGVVEVLSNADLRLTSKWLVTSGITFIKKTMYQSPLRKPEFALLCLANLFGDFTQYLPYIYLPDMMGGVGISLVDASFSISIMGFSNMLGRITNGIILDWSHINTFSFICWSFISSGLCVMVFPFCQNYTAYLIVEILYGISVATYIVAMPILLVDMFGIDFLATTFGLLQLFRGIGCLIGPIVCGILYDSTKSYVVPFVTAGFMFMIGGVLTGIGWAMIKKQLQNNANKEHGERNGGSSLP